VILVAEPESGVAYSWVMSKGKKNQPPVPETNPAEIEGLIERVKTGKMNESDSALVEGLLRLLLKLVWVSQAKEATLARLRGLIFGKSTEKRKKDKLGDPPAGASGGAGGSENAEALSPSSDAPSGETNEDAPKRQGGTGRTPEAKFVGAQDVVVADESLKDGGPCPDTVCGGKLFETGRPNVKVVLNGQPLIGATRYVMPTFICSRCRSWYSTPTPVEAASRHTASSDAAAALAKYGCGIPHNRLADMQKNAGVPVAGSVLWERSAVLAERVLAIYLSLRGEAARAKTLFQDDSGMTVLNGLTPKEGRTGGYTTAMVAETGKNRIALYATGWKHAGENVRDLLERRPLDLDEIRRMGDSLYQNWICEKGVIGKCLVHARRMFTDVEKFFPEQCRVVLDAFGKVFGVEKKAKDLSDEDRLKRHQEESRPVMAELLEWITAEEEAKRIEPASGLGKAVRYLKTHWHFLTQFLRVAGMPLENNIAERAIKSVIRFRKNSLFYKTTVGATVGDILMSVIETCRMNRVNALAYLTTLGSVEKTELWRDPARWLPWAWTNDEV
jgi:transposase